MFCRVGQGKPAAPQVPRGWGRGERRAESGSRWGLFLVPGVCLREKAWTPGASSAAEVLHMLDREHPMGGETQKGPWNLCHTHLSRDETIAVRGQWLWPSVAKTPERP